jgi:hypothetical protein
MPEVLERIYVSSWAAQHCPPEVRVNRYKCELNHRDHGKKIVDVMVTDRQANDEAVTEILQQSNATRHLIEQGWAIGNIWMPDVVDVF